MFFRLDLPPPVVVVDEVDLVFLLPLELLLNSFTVSACSRRSQNATKSSSVLDWIEVLENHLFLPCVRIAEIKVI